MQKYLIIVEGKADAVFIKDCIFHLFENDSSFELADKIETFSRGKPGKIALSPEIKILNAGGFTKIESYRIQLVRFYEQGYKLLVVYDTDDETKNYGGITNRSAYLENIKKNFKIDFSYFLFPNNNDDGNLETLLLQIVNKKKYQQAYTCYKKYADCVLEIGGLENSLELLEPKHRIFSFIRTYHGVDKAKEENRDYRNDFWDFNHTAIAGLLTFFKDFIKNKEE